MALKFRPFQIDDLARAAMHDGAVLSWEQGLGKTFAAFALPLIKDAKRTLIVAPVDLHKQIIKTGLQHFRVHVRKLPDTSTFNARRLFLPPKPTAKPEFYITGFEQLAYVGADESLPKVQNGQLDPGKKRPLDPITISLAAAIGRLTRKPVDLKQYFAGIGCESSSGIRCVWKPSLARVIAQANTFDCVMVDEGTKIQADDSLIGNAVRMLTPRFRYVLTGTPIKNRLECFFWLAWWACGGSATPTARFPYPGNSNAREEFANQHLLHDRFITREEEAAERAALAKGQRHFRQPRKWTHSTWNRNVPSPSGRKIEKRTAKVCNIHRLWKLIAPIVIRRRKDDCREDIAPKLVNTITVRPGTSQQALYKFYLEHPPVAARESPTIPVDRRLQIGMQLTCLRKAALCPSDGDLADTVVDSGVRRHPSRHMPTDLTPKHAVILSLISRLLSSGEQIIIGSPFRTFSQTVHSRLREAGVSSILLDGSVSPARRAELADEFKRGTYSVMVAGQKAVGLGNSFECCSNLILPSLSWAYDENEQFLHRVWRLNSPKPVNIWKIVMSNTIDERLEALFSEKGDSAQLALDGRLVEETKEEICPEQLLAAAVSSFDPTADTIDEALIDAQWHQQLRSQLHYAEQRFREFRGAPHPEVSDSDTTSALKALALPAKSRLSSKLARFRSTLKKRK